MKMRLTKPQSIALAVAVVWACAVYAVSPFYVPTLDSATYSDIAKNIASGNGFILGNAPTDTSPLLPLMLALFMVAAGQAWIPAYLAASAFLMTLSVYFLSEDFKRGSGVVSAALLPTLALPVILSLQVLTDILFLTFVCAGALLLRRFLRSPTYMAAFSASIIVCLSYMLRPTGLFFISFAFLICGWHARKGKLSLKMLMPLLLITIAVAGSWEAYKFFGGFQSTATYRIGMAGEMPESSLSFSLQDSYNGDISFSARLPIQAGNLFRVVIFLAIFAMPTMIVAFCVNAWSAHKSSGKAYDQAFMLVWLAMFLIPHMTLVPSMVARYMLPVIPIFVISFSIYILELLHSNKACVMGKQVDSRLLVVALLVLHMAFSSAAYSWYYSRTEHLTSRVMEDASAWAASLPENATFAVEGVGIGEFHYYFGRVPHNGTADYMIAYDTETNTTLYSVCRRFEDGFHSVEILGRSC